MKNNILSYIMICTLSIFCSCDKKVHSEKQGVAVVLDMPNEDPVSNIDIRVFNSDGILIDSYSFATLEQVGLTTLPLSSGDYTLVTTIDANEHFVVTEQIGTTTLEDLLFTINEPYSASGHVYYGVANTTAVDGTYTQVTIKTSRVFSELELTLNDLSDDILKVEMVIQNTAKGFYPAVHKLTTEYNSTYLDKVDVINNTAKFATTRLLPSVAMAAESRTDTQIKTSVEFTYHYVDGNKVTITATIPKMVNGGTYSPEIDSEVLRPGVVIDITDIKDWGNGSDDEGEILNPT